MKPTVFVVDDDPALRSSLQFLLDGESIPVECFGSAEEFDASFHPDRPGCLLLDLQLPAMSGLVLFERLKKRGLLPPTIIISGHGNIGIAVETMTLGAVDFLEKPAPGPRLLAAIKKALALDGELRSRRSESLTIYGRMKDLTRRERQVLKLVVDGKSNKDMARILNVALKTIEAHRNSVKGKMKVTSVAELVRMFLLVKEILGQPAIDALFGA